jgi:hypothetical protein
MTPFLLIRGTCRGFPFGAARDCGKSLPAGATWRAQIDLIDTAEQPSTMRFRNPQAVRPEAAADVGPRLGEYPLPILTRRTFSQWAAEALIRRESAPNTVRCEPRANPDLVRNPSNPSE